MTGRLIAVVGPSGVGKDSVMEGLAAHDSRLSLVRRVITRPSAAGGEDFDGVTEAVFADLRDQGTFALHWGAHGLYYGIPADIQADLAAGKDLLANLSRSVLLEAAQRFPGMKVLSITADREVLAQRLSARGRETSEEIAQRLERANYALPNGLNVIELDNSGALEDTIKRAASLLYPVRG